MNRSIALIAVSLSVSACGGSGHNGSVVASGHIEAIDVRVATKVRGRLLQRPVDEGDTVKAGQLVAVVDTIDAEACPARGDRSARAGRRGAAPPSRWCSAGRHRRTHGSRRKRPRRSRRRAKGIGAPRVARRRRGHHGEVARRRAGTPRRPERATRKRNPSTRSRQGGKPRPGGRGRPGRARCARRQDRFSSTTDRRRDDPQPRRWRWSAKKRWEPSNRSS